MTRSHPAPWRRLLAVTLLLGFVPLASGCFGSFALTRKAYDFNKTVSSNKWVRWLVFIALGGPMFSLTTGIDVLFSNTMEFWTGSTPINARLDPQTVVGENGEVATLVPVENGARLVVTEAGGQVHSVTLLREAGGGIAAYDAEGALRGRLVGLDAGEPRFADLPR
jgi:hypothetical protein